MRLFHYTLAIGLFLNHAASFSEEKSKASEQSVFVTPIRALISSNAPKGFIWVHATVINADENDALIIQDKSGKILLFLPTDELIALGISMGNELYVLGKLDISPVHPSKNELYAERIIFAEKPVVETIKVPK